MLYFVTQKSALSYVMFSKRTERGLCEGFFLLHWLLMLYKAKLNMYAHRISFSAARSRSILA